MIRRFLLLGLVSVTQLVALPVGNPADPELFCDGVVYDSWLGECLPSWCGFFQPRIGYYQDRVTERNLELDTTCDISSNLLNTKLVTQGGMAVVNLCRRVDLFGILGTSQYRYIANTSTFQTTSTAPVVEEMIVQSNQGFSWSVGGKALVWDCGSFSVGVEGQYLHARPKISYLATTDAQVTADTDVIMGSCGQTTNYQEWQVGLGSAYACGCFVPYLAVKAAGCTLDSDSPLFTVIPTTFVLRLDDLRNAKTWGYAVGASVMCGCYGSLTLEARGGDEIGYYLSGQLQF